MKHRLIFLLLLGLSACTTIDDYMLGRDNTPVPKSLQPLTTSRVNLVEKWTISTGRPYKASAYLKLKPVIRGNYLYTATTSGLVEAIERKTAKVIWSTVLPKGIDSGPTVSSDVIALGTNASTVVLLSSADGHKLWEVNVSSDVLSKPLITDQKVIVKTIDGNLYGLNKATGNTLWMSEHGSPSLILKASSSPILMDNLVLVGFSDGKLDAIHVQTGHQVWQRGIAYANGTSDVERLVDIDADPIVRGDMVYLASYQGYIGGLSIASGQFLWNKPASIYKNMAIDEHTIYATDSHDVVWAFNRMDGRVKWKQVTLKSRGLTEPVKVGHLLLVGDKTGILHCISTENGDLVGRTQLKAGIDIAPAVLGHDVYVMTTHGQISHYVVNE